MTTDNLTSEELGVMLMEFLATLDKIPVTGILAALSTVTASIACEAGFSEKDSVEAFRECFKIAQKRVNTLKKGLN